MGRPVRAVLRDPRAGLASPAPFDPGADYRRYVDGRASEDGVAGVSAPGGVDVPRGERGESPGAWTVHGLAARKNDLYLRRLPDHGVRVFAGTVDLVRRLRPGAVPVGLVTASRNAHDLLATADLSEQFDVIVDGTVAPGLALGGKPDPAMFLEAARRLQVDPARAAVVEDAFSGVTAANAGGFGPVVGVDRAGQRAALEAAWDELFILPVVGAHLPAVTRALLDHRSRRCAVPAAERWRRPGGDTRAAAQPPLGTVDAGQLPTPTPRRPRRRTRARLTAGSDRRTSAPRQLSVGQLGGSRIAPLHQRGAPPRSTCTNGPDP